MKPIQKESPEKGFLKNFAELSKNPYAAVYCEIKLQAFPFLF